MILIFIISFFLGGLNADFYLPINSIDRKSISEINLTGIGEFGLMRKARPGIPAHYHTGIDIKRPNGNYQNSLIFSIYEGVVISKREDGPYAQIIIEHEVNDRRFWTIYEHIAGIQVSLYDYVNPEIPIARFMNKNELNNYGWQFDHFHLEILKVQPQKIQPNSKNPERHFSSYSLVCYTLDDLKKYYYIPMDFLKKKLEY